MSFGGETVEVIQSILDQSLTNFGRARQRPDRIVVIEENRVSQLPDIIETPLGAGFLLCGNARLSACRNDATD